MSTPRTDALTGTFYIAEREHCPDCGRRHERAKFVAVEDAREMEAEINEARDQRDNAVQEMNRCHLENNALAAEISALKQPRGSNPESAKRIAEIRERCDMATDGPWRSCGGATPKFGAVHSNDGYIVFGMADNQEDIENHKAIQAPAYQQQARNKEFIAHARADIPYLLSRVTALEAKLAEAVVALQFYSKHDKWTEVLAEDGSTFGGMAFEDEDTNGQPWLVAETALQQLATGKEGEK